MSRDQLPKDVLPIIFKNLSPRDWIAVMYVCKIWRQQAFHSSVRKAISVQLIPWFIQKFQPRFDAMNNIINKNELIIVLNKKTEIPGKIAILKDLKNYENKGTYEIVLTGHYFHQTRSSIRTNPSEASRFIDFIIKFLERTYLLPQNTDLKVMLAQLQSEMSKYEQKFKKKEPVHPFVPPQMPAQPLDNDLDNLQVVMQNLIFPQNNDFDGLQLAVRNRAFLQNWNRAFDIFVDKVPKRAKVCSFMSLSMSLALAFLGFLLQSVGFITQSESLNKAGLSLSITGGACTIIVAFISVCYFYQIIKRNWVADVQPVQIYDEESPLLGSPPLQRIERINNNNNAEDEENREGDNLGPTYH